MTLLIGGSAMLPMMPIMAQTASDVGRMPDPTMPHTAPPSAMPATLAARGFRVDGVGNHPEADITPARIQALADAQYQELAALQAPSAQPLQLTVAQLQGVADRITEYYRRAGFIVATARLPPQTIAADQIIQIQVGEGRIGKVIVSGAKRYQPSVIAASAEDLVGKPVQKRDIDTAVLYARDLPAVTVTSILQPGEHTGETDLMMIATEAPRPYTVTAGGNNYGSDTGGRYHAQMGMAWNNPLGIGDSLAANIDYAIDPSQSIFGGLAYRAPTLIVPGLSVVVGATRSELQINNGAFSALQIKGNSTSWYGGMDWKFINRTDLQAQASLRYIREQSMLESRDIPISNQKFDLAELSLVLSRTGIDLLQASVRQSISDNSAQPDFVSPLHASHFLVSKLAYTRLQMLTRSQRLYLKLVGQYTQDALTPLEQFAIGGPNSVRAYPIADALSDKGYYAALEYHIDAPGFGDVASPFDHRPWRELLTLRTFVDYARGFPAGANRIWNANSVTYSGAGAGFTFRLPQFQNFELNFDAAVPLGAQAASDGRHVQFYARFGFTF